MSDDQKNPFARSTIESASDGHADVQVGDEGFDRWLQEVRNDLVALDPPDQKVQKNGLIKIFERVHQIDAQCVTPAMLDEVWRQNHAEELQRADDPRLQAMIVAAQHAARRDAGRLPAPRFAGILARTRLNRGWRPALTVMMGLAAALALVWGIDNLTGSSALLRLTGLASGGRQVAVDQREETAAGGRSVDSAANRSRELVHEAGTDSVTNRENLVMSDPSDVPPSVEPELPPPLPAPVVQVAPPPNRSRDRLLQWDEEAQMAWRQGDRARATSLFLAIISADRQGHFAQAAYGDLFLLAREHEDVPARRKLWQAYLKRFAKGRFADDARAGLCRSDTLPEKAACWHRYLVDFPQGAYRSEAVQATHVVTNREETHD